MEFRGTSMTTPSFPEGAYISRSFGLGIVAFFVCCCCIAGVLRVDGGVGWYG